MNPLPPTHSAAQNQFAAAEQLAQAGRPAEAWSLLQALDRGLLPSAQHGAFDFLCGRTLLELQRPLEALAPLQTAARAQNNPGFRMAYGAALHLTGNLDEAGKQYREAMRLAPAAENPPFNLAKLLLDQGDFDGAIRAYRTALSRKANYPDALAALAELLTIRGETAEAVTLCERALQRDPRHALSWNALGKAREQRLAHAEAAKHYQQACERDPALAEAWFNLARMNCQLGQPGPGARHFARARELEPDNEKFAFVAGYLLDATAAKPDRPPARYVRELFDQYAHTFDQSLVDRLGYRPQQVFEAIEPWLRERRRQGGKIDALDLGCGTGLIGPLLAADCRTLTGVDLSPKMLEKARNRGYTALHEGDINAFLQEAAPRACDLVIAADVFIYIGEVEAVFRGVGRTLRPAGLFAFSVESLDALAGAEDTAPFKLLPTGRYAHADRYLHKLAHTNGFQLVSQAAVYLRMEAGAPIKGAVYAFQLA